MNVLHVVYADKYLLYDLGENHPIPKDKTKLFFKLLDNQEEIKYQVHEPKPVKWSDLLLVHCKTYLDRLERLAKNHQMADPDTPVNPGILEGSRYIVGGTIMALELALRGEKVVNLIGGMHHAGISTSGGFCIYNDHAVAIKILQKEKKVKKAIVYDLDVHAGQGTQEIFYNDPSVMTVSIHQDPQTIYPGVGFPTQKGEGKARGTNLNVILPPNTKEKVYLDAVSRMLDETSSFKSDVVVIVLGVDTYKNDLLGGLRLEKESYHKIGERFRECKKSAVLFSGGYSDMVPQLWLSFLKGYLQ